MTYRGDLDAAQARANALESELEEAKREIGELRGGQALVLANSEEKTLAKSNPNYSRFLGGPKAIALERTIEAQLDSDDFIELIQLITRHTGDAGTVSSMVGSATWSASSSGKNSSPPQVTITCLRGKTTIRVDHNLRTLGTALFGGIGGGLGINLTVHSAIWPIVAGFPAIGIIAAPTALIATIAGCRSLFKKMAKTRVRKASELLAVLVAAVERIASRETASERPTD